MSNGIPPKRPTWATAIGVIALIMGILGAVGACMGPGYPLFARIMVPILEEQNLPGMAPTIAQMKVASQYLVHFMITGLIAMAIAVILIVAATGTLRMRRWAGKATVTWAVAKMIYALPAAWIAFVFSEEQFSAMAVASEGDPMAVPGFYRMMSGMTWGILVFQLLWLWALPVFMLVWYRRRSIREQIQEWPLPGGESGKT